MQHRGSQYHKSQAEWKMLEQATDAPFISG